jgi:hypothetical protein
MIILGIIVLLMAIAAIVCMQLLSISSLIKDIREEERIKARKYGIRVANRRYRDMIKNTKCVVHQKVVISNESNIKW